MDVAVAAGSSVPRGLQRSTCVVVFDARLIPETLRETPIHRLATVLVHLAARPRDVHSWRAIGDALPELVDSVDRAELEVELADRPASVSVRVAYLVQALDPDLADRLATQSRGKVWFGPRGRLKRHSQRFGVADTLLPFDPATLGRDEP
jgi:hypothetical protein